MRSKISREPLASAVARHCELSGFTLFETAYAPGFKMPRHAHESAAFGVVLQGAYTEQHDRHTRTCQPTTIVFHPADEEHAVEFHQASVRIFRLEAKPHWLARVREHTAALDQPAEFHGGPASQLALRLYREFQEMDEAAPLAMEGLAFEILVEASRSGSRRAEPQPPGWLKQARDLLHAEFSENLTLPEIALAVGVHPVYLARQFRKHYHCTIGEYVRRLRIECACRKIAQSDAPLIEIAAAAGFYDQSHFSRTFKRLTGLTPAEYRTASRAS
jgi:AraC family transcriptional regulator